MTVYFIQESDSGAVKIGFSANAESRLRSMQTGNSQQLELIRAVDGGANQERAFHALFSRQRIRGEWFTFTPEMLTALPTPMSCPRPSKKVVIHSHEKKLIIAFIREIGRGELQRALGLSASSITNAIYKGSLPASWFKIVCQLACKNNVLVPMIVFAWAGKERVEPRYVVPSPWDDLKIVSLSALRSSHPEYRPAHIDESEWRPAA